MEIIGSEYDSDVEFIKLADGFDEGMSEREELKVNSKLLAWATE